MPRMAWGSLGENPARFAGLLEAHHWVVLSDVPPQLLAACTAAARESLAFFGQGLAEKRACTHGHVGYREFPKNGREDYHFACDVMASLRWPTPAMGTAMVACAAEMDSLARKCLEAALLGSGRPCIGEEAVCHLDLGPSVLDTFRYDAGWISAPAGSVLLDGHYDPGFFTLEPRASASGLQLLDGQSLQWVTVEPHLGDEDVAVFSGEALRAVSGRHFRAGFHRVMAPCTERLALAYELRSLAALELPTKLLSNLQ